MRILLNSIDFLDLLFGILIAINVFLGLLDVVHQKCYKTLLIVVSAEENYYLM